ncbi:hypothetical protein [Jatrophihabitans sp.]|jgi:hypothetical protein|uniref:hypothetical protein n=1 Tax=Jatrophihabitans sp. TaxID=1932789 RepID=UPI002F0BE104
MRSTLARRAVLAAVGVGSTVAALTIAANPASAVDGWTEATLYSSNGGGAHVKAYVNWTSSSHEVNWTNIYVNDFCNSAGNGDGLTARLEFMVHYVGSSSWVTVGSREDTGGCTSAAYTESSAHWGPTNAAINDAGIRACLGSSCSSISYRDDPNV